MRRLARPLFTLVSAASALLCVATCALWVESHEFGERNYVGSGPEPVNTPLVSAFGRVVQAFAWEGSAHLYVSFDMPGDLRRQQDVWTYCSLYWPGPYGPRVFEYRSRPALTSAPASTGFQHLAIDLWVPALLAIVLPACWVRRGVIAWRRRSRPGCCPLCGYDLRATPQRCPECGTASGAQ